jgi:hypothetical protein
MKKTRPSPATCLRRLLGFALVFGVAAAATAADSLPGARDIIAKFVKASGGREAILKNSSRHYTGTFEMPAQGLRGDLEVFAAKPNKQFIKIKVPMLGEILSGFDGKVGWSLDPFQGPMVMKDKPLEQMREQSDFYGELYEEKDYSKMETVGEEEFEGKKCHKLRLVRKSGREIIAFFDQKTGLLAGNQITQETALGAVPVTSVVSEYKKLGNFTLPVKVSQKIGPVEQVLTISTAEYDTVSDSVFELPAQIQGLLKPDADGKKDEKKK